MSKLLAPVAVLLLPIVVVAGGILSFADAALRRAR